MNSFQSRARAAHIAVALCSRAIMPARTAQSLPGVNRAGTMLAPR
jgi:hypothetical protein